MSYKRTIAIIISIVILIALALQIVRSESTFIKLVNSDSSQENKLWDKEYAVPDYEFRKNDRDNYIVVIDSSDKNSVNLKNETAEVLTLMKKRFSIHDIAYEDKLNLKANTIIICVTKIDKIHDISQLMSFIENGGNVFFETVLDIGTNYYQIYRKLGIISGSEITGDAGIKLKTNIILKGKDISIGKDFITNAVIAVTLDKRCRVHVLTQGDIPLVWDTYYGKGKIMVFNGTMLNEKRSRGLITGALSLLNDDYIYPVFNLKIVYIDDFPAPFPSGYNSNIYKEYGRSIKVFLRDVWWPDMIRIKNLYDIKYTAALIISYDDLVKAPFLSLNKVDNSNLVLYGRELLKNGDEMCFHGYNHQSLVTKDESQADYVTNELKYNLFNNEADICDSIKAFNVIFKSVYKDYKITCYVPPSNVLGKVARKSIKKVMPNIQTISSVYYNVIDNGTYEQEFNIAEDGILELPRITHGFINDELNFWALVNNITTSGVFSHYCQPDEVLVSEINKNESWEQLSKEFESIFKIIKKDYSWLRSMTISNAAHNARNVLTNKPYFEYAPDKIKGYMNGYAGDYSFILRTNKTAYSAEACKVEVIDEGAYLITTSKPFFIVGLK